MAVNLTGIVNRRLRAYDNTSPTPYFVELFQVSPDPIPASIPRTNTVIQPDSGRMTAKAGTYVEDETVPFQPLEFTVTIGHMSEHLQLFDALGNPRKKPTWVIGGNTWTPYGSNDIGTRLNSLNEPIACVFPRDIPASAYMFSLVVGYDVPKDSIGGSPLFIRHWGVINTNFTEAFDSQLAQMTMTFQTYGAVSTLLNDWPDGNECFPVS